MFGNPDIPQHIKNPFCFANPCCDVSVSAPPPLFVDHTSLIDKGRNLSDGLSTDCDWCVGSGINFH
jgi:hypothetical protein